MDAPIPHNQIYYFRVGNGEWQGQFTFHMDDWRAFWRDDIGLKNRFLALSMFVLQRLLGSSTIYSTLRAFPEWGSNGVATNVVRIKKLGITLYTLKEQYVLHPDGTNVWVRSHERFGPIPFLFRESKSHPARVGEGGRHTRYLDMPLLGTLWEGNYRVLADKDHVDAELRCSWASAQEVIARVGPRDETDRVITENQNQVTALDGVVDRLRMYRERYEAVHDSRATFTHAYTRITEIFREEIPRREFEDEEWTLDLLIAFAREYFAALEAYDLGGEVPGGWQSVFDAIEDGRTSVLEELILSMTAHIVHDLPLALDEVRLQEGDRSKLHDYHLANDVLEHGIDKIQDSVERRYNPLLGWLDHLGAQEDELLTNYGIRLSRAAAWYNAERLVNPETGTEAHASITRSVQVAVQHLLSPSLLSLRIFLRLARWMSRSTRRWPD